jgi:hypothetical protein
MFLSTQLAQKEASNEHWTESQPSSIMEAQQEPDKDSSLCSTPGSLRSWSSKLLLVSHLSKTKNSPPFPQVPSLRQCLTCDQQKQQQHPTKIPSLPLRHCWWIYNHSVVPHPRTFLHNAEIVSAQAHTLKANWHYQSNMGAKTRGEVVTQVPHLVGWENDSSSSLSSSNSQQSDISQVRDAMGIITC